MPLTLAITLFGVAVLRDWIGLTSDINSFLIVALFLLLSLLATTSIGYLFGLDTGVSISEALDKIRIKYKWIGVLSFLGNILIAYAKAYGLWNFISSLAVGGFLAWAWAHKILPQLLRENTVDNETKETIPLYKWLTPILFVLFLIGLPITIEFLFQKLVKIVELIVESLYNFIETII